MNFNPPLEWLPPPLQVLTEHLRPAELSAAVFRLAQQALAALPFTKISHAEVGGLSELFPGSRGSIFFWGDAPGHHINWVLATHQGENSSFFRLTIPSKEGGCGVNDGKKPLQKSFGANFRMHI